MRRGADAARSLNNQSDIIFLARDLHQTVNFNLTQNMLLSCHILDQLNSLSYQVSVAILTAKILTL